MDSKESFLKVYLINGNSNQIRFNELTDVDLVISLLTNRLSSDGNDRVLKKLFSIRVIKYPDITEDLNKEDLNEIVWLDNADTIYELIKKYNLNLETCKFELRIRYFAFEFQQILEQDRVTFYYLYDQVKNDYFQTKKQINQETAINLCCLEIRRFFKDISQFALDKKSNYDCLEKEIGLFKFLHSSVISSVKPKVLRKLIQNQFKKILNLDEIQCMFRFLDIVDGIICYKTENYKCEFKISSIHYLPVRLVIGNEVGISYYVDNASSLTQMACFQQIASFQTLLKNTEDLKNFEMTPDFVYNKKCILQLQIFGADELLSIVCPSIVVIQNIAQLIDNYCKFQMKKLDSLWINKFNHFRPKEQTNDKVNGSQRLLKKQAIYDNEEKDYAEIVEDDDYSVPIGKLNEIDRSQVKILNLIGSGNFAKVYKGVYKNEQSGQEIEVAIKTCKEDESSPDYKISNKFLEEAYIMHQFEHRHIIKLVGICPSSPISMASSPLIVMELAKYGELKKFLQENKSKIGLSKLILYSYQLSTALAYLEQASIIHIDLAIRNVLACSFDCVKLTDFGLSKIIHNENSYYKASERKLLPIKYISPESINFRRFTKSSDVWSFAVLVWEILSYGERKPFDGVKNREVIHKIESNERLSMPEICPPNLYNLLLHCWQYEPTKRPCINQVKTFLHELLVNDSESNSESRELFDEEFKQSLLDTQLKSQEKQSIEDAAWLKNASSSMFGSCHLNTSSDNQSLESESTSISSNPFLDSLEIDKSDTLQNLSKLNREEDDVYKFTTSVTICVKQLLDHVNKGELDLYFDRAKTIGIELRMLLSTVDDLIEKLPPEFHNEINQAHRILSKDFGYLIDSLKNLQKYHHTTIEHEFKKKCYKSAHVLVIDCKNLLDTVDSVRLKALGQQADQEVLE